MLCYGQEEKGLPPTPDTLHLGYSYYLHSSQRFLSTWDVVMLKKKKKKKKPVQELTVVYRQAERRRRHRFCLHCMAVYHPMSGYDKLAIFCNCDMQLPFADSRQFRLTNIVWLHAMIVCCDLTL